MDEDGLPDRGGGQQGSAPSIRRLLADNGSPDGDQTPAATRITLRPHNPGTGEEIDKREVTADEVKALDVESTKIVHAGEVDFKARFLRDCVDVVALRLRGCGSRQLMRIRPPSWVHAFAVRRLGCEHRRPAEHLRTADPPSTVERDANAP